MYKLREQITKFTTNMKYFDFIWVRNKGEKTHLFIYFNATQLFLWKKVKEYEQHNKVIYLKINQNSLTSMMSIRKWVNVAKIQRAHVILICDKKELKKNILKSHMLDDSSFEFIPSMKNEIRDFIEGKLYLGKMWQKCAYAHVTSFFHAYKQEIDSYWTIDADDTMFFLDDMDVAHVFNEVEVNVKERKVDVISLDMWSSRTGGKYWTFGVVYVNNNRKSMECIKKNDGLHWTKPYEKYDNGKNIDWFFTYLRDNELLNVETFYVKNASFVHWGPVPNNFLLNPIGVCITNWNDENVVFPIKKYVLNREDLGTIPICADVAIDIGLIGNEGAYYMNNSVMNKYGKKLRTLWRM